MSCLPPYSVPISAAALWMLAIIGCLFLPAVNGQKRLEQLFAQRDVIVYLGGRAYNITDFLPQHPGGALVLRMANGQDVEQHLMGHKFILGICHTHEHAFDVLRNYEMPQLSVSGPSSTTTATSVSVPSSTSRTGVPMRKAIVPPKKTQMAPSGGIRVSVEVQMANVPRQVPFGQTPLRIGAPCAWPPCWGWAPFGGGGAPLGGPPMMSPPNGGDWPPFPAQ